MEHDWKRGDRAIHRHLSANGTVIERVGKVTDKRSEDVFMFLPDRSLWDSDLPVLRENLRPAPDARALVWLHRTEIGERYPSHQVHPDLKPALCKDCACFIEADEGDCP